MEEGGDRAYHALATMRESRRKGAGRLRCAVRALLLRAICSLSGGVVLFLAAQVGTGKTSLVRQYVHKTFSNNYKSTIGEIRAIDIAARTGPVRAAETGSTAQVWTLR